jgi:hypothetical protein
MSKQVIHVGADTSRQGFKITPQDGSLRHWECEFDSVATSGRRVLRAGFEIARMVKIGNEPRLCCRAPSQPFLRLRA